MGNVFAVGVGPGSQNYITEIVRKVIVDADVVVGYKYTLDIISSLIQGKKIHIITMDDQEKTYQQIKKELEDEILDDLLPKNISTQIHKAFLENSASEQGSRMTAMDSATRNAGEMIGDLTLTYNKARQAYITKELIEIVNGAEALKA